MLVHSPIPSWMKKGSQTLAREVHMAGSRVGTSCLPCLDSSVPGLHSKHIIVNSPLAVRTKFYYLPHVYKNKPDTVMKKVF